MEHRLSVQRAESSAASFRICARAIRSAWLTRLGAGLLAMGGQKIHPGPNDGEDKKDPEGVELATIPRSVVPVTGPLEGIAMIEKLRADAVGRIVVALVVPVPRALPWADREARRHSRKEDSLHRECT